MFCFHSMSRWSKRQRSSAHASFIDGQSLRRGGQKMLRQSSGVQFSTPRQPRLSHFLFQVPWFPGKMEMTQSRRSWIWKRATLQIFQKNFDKVPRVTLNWIFTSVSFCPYAATKTLCQRVPTLESAKSQSANNKYSQSINNEILLIKWYEYKQDVWSSGPICFFIPDSNGLMPCCSMFRTLGWGCSLCDITKHQLPEWVSF